MSDLVCGCTGSVPSPAEARGRGRRQPQCSGSALCALYLLAPQAAMGRDAGNNGRRWTIADTKTVLVRVPREAESANEWTLAQE